MDEDNYYEISKEIKQKSVNVQGVLDTEKCFVRKYGNKFNVDLHVVVDGKITVEKGHNIAHNLQEYLQQNVKNIGSVLIHIEPFNTKFIKNDINKRGSS